MSNPKQGEGNKQGAKKPWENGGRKSWSPSKPKDEKRRVPMLKYGQGNFHVFMEELSTECLTKCVNVGKLIEFGVYYKIVQPLRMDSRKVMQKMISYFTMKP